LGWFFARNTLPLSLSVIFLFSLSLFIKIQFGWHNQGFFLLLSRALRFLNVSLNLLNVFAIIILFLFFSLFLFSIYFISSDGARDRALHVLMVQVGFTFMGISLELVGIDPDGVGWVSL
jgi:hypothetical protein